MIQFAALTEPLMPEDIEAFRQLRSGASSSKAAMWWIIGVVAFGMFMLIIPGLFAGDEASPASLFGVPIVFASLFAIFGVIFYITSKIRMRQLARIYKFCTQNKLRFTLLGGMPTEPGIIFSQGSQRIGQSIVDFPNGLRVANYQYITGSGKSQQTHLWTFARLPLERHVPNMMLDAKRNNFLQTFTNLPTGYRKSQVQKIQPELDKLYTLFAPVTYDQDVYYIFTPDVIAALVDAGGDFDIEVVDNILYFYASARLNLSKEETWKRILKVTDAVGKELRDQTDYYSDANVGNRHADVIAPEGQRLRKGITAATVISIILFAVYFIVSMLPVFMR